MAREWSERHIRDLVHSEWEKMGGGGGGGDSDGWIGKDGIFSRMMTEFVLGADGALGKTGGLPSVLLDQWTEDIDRSGVRYHYKRMRYKVKVTNTSLNISRPSGLIPSTVYDIHYEIEGSLNIPEPDAQMYTNCNGWINSYVQCSLPSGIGDFGTTKYYLGTILEGVGAGVLWLPIEYVNCGNDITIEETGEEFVLRTYTRGPKLLCVGIASNSQINTGYTGSRTFRKSRDYRVRLTDTGNITTEEA